MKNLGELLVALLLVSISSAIVAWGYQVFWNCVVFNFYTNFPII